ncbi:MAG: hypothetical protein IPI77_19725 [Saprospiraceae bacterium]|nr:hypothetical protein [Saprospiraceae bacterium]
MKNRESNLLDQCHVWRDAHVPNLCAPDQAQFILVNDPMVGPFFYRIIEVLFDFVPGSIYWFVLFEFRAWLSLLGAYSITFAANHIVLVGAGHLTKIAALGFVPLIFVGLHLLLIKIGSSVFWFYFRIGG